MSETNDDTTTTAKSDRVGNDYHEGPNPEPGGDTDLSGSTLPPYDDRSTGDEEVAAGVGRAMGSDQPVKEPEQPGDGPPPAGGDTVDPEKDMAPDNVGESINRRGEDQADKEGKEAGREEHGTDDTGRPAGGSTPRDQTSINPHDDDRIS